MLTYTELRSKVDTIWNKLWTGGLSNPMDAIEQLSYLLFLKMMDDEENARELRARRRNEPYEPSIAQELRWGHWTKFQAGDALRHLKQEVFPYLQQMGDEGSSFRQYMANAECKINKPNLLIEVSGLIDEMDISAQVQDVKGDIYEYLLSKLNVSGRNGQFRTPRHIVNMMVQMVAPQPMERIGDLAAGTGGFLVGVYQYIMEQHTSADIWQDGQGERVGDLLEPEEREFLHNGALRGYDNDSGMTMLRIGSMNLMLHGIRNPKFFYMDTLSKDYDEPKDYDVILMNPPFKGAVDRDDVNKNLPSNTTKSELLFLHRILRALDMGGRCAVIVPDGVLFGSSRAHIATRRKLIEDNRLEGVVSMPSGVFRPYAGVSTAVLLFTRGGETDQIWFYDMTHDGFSLDDKRLPISENDILDILLCWQNRDNEDFCLERKARLDQLRHELAPLRRERLGLEGEIHRLKFESVIASEDDALANEELEVAQGKISELDNRIVPLKAEIDLLTQQFWVSVQEIKENKYDLSASRYRQVEQDVFFYEEPNVTMERILSLGQVIADEVQDLRGFLG